MTNYLEGLEDTPEFKAELDRIHRERPNWYVTIERPDGKKMQVVGGELNWLVIQRAYERQAATWDNQRTGPDGDNATSPPQAT